MECRVLGGALFDGCTRYGIGSEQKISNSKAHMPYSCTLYLYRIERDEADEAKRATRPRANAVTQRRRVGQPCRTHRPGARASVTWI